MERRAQRADDERLRAGRSWSTRTCPVDQHSFLTAIDSRNPGIGGLVERFHAAEGDAFLIPERLEHRDKELRVVRVRLQGPSLREVVDREGDAAIALRAVVDG